MTFYKLRMTAFALVMTFLLLSGPALAAGLEPETADVLGRDELSFSRYAEEAKNMTLPIDGHRGHRR